MTCLVSLCDYERGRIRVLYFVWHHAGTMRTPRAWSCTRAHVQLDGKAVCMSHVVDMDMDMDVDGA